MLQVKEHDGTWQNLPDGAPMVSGKEYRVIDERKTNPETRELKPPVIGAQRRICATLPISD